MRIQFDSQIFCAQNVGGISRYFSCLASQLCTLPDVQPSIVAPLHINAYLEGLPAGLVHGWRLRGRSHASAPLRAASILGGAIAQYMRPPDIVHRTYYYPVPPAPRSSRCVITVYDMIHEKFPQDFPSSDPIRAWKSKAVRRADHIICISQQTRRDLLSLESIPEDRVSVIYLSHDSLGEVAGDETEVAFRRRKLGFDMPYLLYVGSRTPYKNFRGLLSAYQASRALRASYHLLCFGGGAFTMEELALLSRTGLCDAVTQISGTDADLAASYRHASLFVYPSLYEGFGLPPLEAMSLGCAVACSNTSSIPEVVGDAAETFDPAEPIAIRESLERVLGSPQRRAELVARGFDRCRLFSWRRCAQETVDVYRRTLAS
jgi:glycosyltransferase involved in cell wall biosynthesis